LAAAGPKEPTTTLFKSMEGDGLRAVAQRRIEGQAASGLSHSNVRLGFFTSHDRVFGSTSGHFSGWHHILKGIETGTTSIG